MPPVSKDRRGVHIVDPTPQAHFLTLCEQGDLQPEDDAVSITQAHKATCPQCLAIVALLPELAHAAQA